MPSLGISAPYPFPFYENLPSALVGFDKQNRPVAFCRLNLDHSLTCFDKQAREYQVGTLFYPTKLYTNWKLTLKKPVSPYIAKMVPQISRFCYQHGGNHQPIDGCGMPELNRNISDIEFEIDATYNPSKVWEMDNSWQHRAKLVGTLPAAVLKKMATYSQEDSNSIDAQGRAFVAETQPGYNIPSRSGWFSGGSNQSGGTIYGGGGGNIGRIGPDGIIYGGGGGVIGKISQDGTVYGGGGGIIGHVPAGDKAAAVAMATSMIAKAQGMKNPFPGL